jgi:hypothetical protein
MIGNRYRFVDKVWIATSDNPASSHTLVQASNCRQPTSTFRYDTVENLMGQELNPGPAALWQAVLLSFIKFF